jgi:hypothetical protein
MAWVMRCRLLALILALCSVAVLAPAAHAFRLPAQQLPTLGGPLGSLVVQLPADEEVYDGARRCMKRERPGVVRLTSWLQRHAAGAYWGSYRCEKWGKRSASLHAENRAIDWHLSTALEGDRDAARRLIHTLLAPDALGNVHALARRMGVQEIIWDCAYWGAGMENFRDYSPCFTRKGKPRRRVDVTVAHRDHIHFGLSKDGAAARTSFWRATLQG